MRMNMCWIAVLAICAMTAGAAILIEDDFIAENGELWETQQSPLGAAPVFADGRMTLQAGPGVGHKSIVLSQNTQVNPFLRPLTVTFSGLELTGDPGDGETVFYSVIGRQEKDKAALYKYDRDLYDEDGGGLGLKISLVGSGYKLRVDEFGAGAGAKALLQFNLSAMPSEVIWSVDGVAGQCRLDVVGAELQGVGVNKKWRGTTASGSFSCFRSSEFTSSDISRLVFGVMSVGQNVREPAVLSIDRLTVE